MPIAPVDDRGTVLYYEDSGAPLGSTQYATLVLIHGAGFHGASFRRMIPFAVPHNLRLIIPNLRDYPGSTPYTSEELEMIRGPDREQQEGALRSRAFELAAFLKWVIEASDIPQMQGVPETEAVQGGVALVSWSAGNCQTMGLFAYANQLPEATRSLLDVYLRSYVLYEPSLASTGGPVPTGLRAIKATREPGMSLDDLATAFSLTASAYYPPFTFPQAIEPLPTYASRAALHENRCEVDPRHTPTITRMSPEELGEMVHAEVIDTNGSQNLFRIMNPEVYRTNVERALFDRRCVVDGALKEVWPALRVHIVWCDMSVGDCIWASVLLHYRHADAQPAWRRPIALHKLGGANHFVHWEEPERFVEVLAGFI